MSSDDDSDWAALENQAHKIKSAKKGKARKGVQLILVAKYVSGVTNINLLLQSFTRKES